MRGGCALIAVLPMCLMLSACAGQGPATGGIESNGAALNGDLDDAPETAGRIAPTLSYGAEIEITYELERNFDLDSREPDDQAIVQPSMELAFSFEPDERIEAFVNFKLERELFVRNQQDDASSPTSLEIDQAYLQLKAPGDQFTLTLGRQDLDDEREWFYDSKFDALLISLEYGRLEIDLSANREQIVDRDVLNADRKDRVNNFFATLEYDLVEEDDGNRWFDEIKLLVFAVVRDDRGPNDEDPAFFGVRSVGELFGDLEYWADFAIVRGNEGGEALRGYGLDVGGSYEFDLEFDPSITLGYAFGSGDDSPDDSTDHAFRQTGLEDNQGKFGGVTKFKYYGELVDPELSNLSILTAGIGFNPTRRSSIDFVYHHYRLNQLAESMRSASVEESLTGKSRDVGDELDLVMGWLGHSGLGVDLVFSYFFPGSAYAVRDGAFFTSVELKYEF